MKVRRKLWIAASAGLLIFMASAGLFAEEAEKTGKNVLQKADSRFYPEEGTFEFYLKMNDVDGSVKEYRMQGYKKGVLYQTGVWIAPDINKNDVGMRCGDTIYYKPVKWTKPEVQSYQSLFMDTGFSWGDVDQGHVESPRAPAAGADRGSAFHGSDDAAGGDTPHDGPTVGSKG